MEASRDWVAAAAAGEVRDADGSPLPVYGVNTGYGSLARMRIPAEDIERLSWNLIRSHAAGMGEPVAPDVVRAMMLLRANALAKGASGCRPVLVERLLEMLEKGVTPIVPSQGSCGSSGDLAPLCHLALVLFRGEDVVPHESGSAWYRGERMSGHEAMQRAGLTRLVPAPKEGLAITNGAQLTTAVAALATVDADILVRAAEIAAAMSWEALRGVTRALHPAVHALRPYRGAVDCASNLRRLLAGASLVDSVPEKVQDAYALRCTPQVLGASRDGMRFAASQIAVELNAVTDNPVFVLDADDPNKAFSAGLFHGEPVGLAADHLKLSLSEVGSISERRIFRLTTAILSAELPPLLSRDGVGLMAPQGTAAALVLENRSLAWPASVDSIPTCEDQEDHVAMSTTAARRAAEVGRNTRDIIAIEFLCALEALRHRCEDASVQLGAGSRVVTRFLEGVVVGNDGVPSDDIRAISERIPEIVEAVEAEIGPLLGVLDV